MSSIRRLSTSAKSTVRRLSTDIVSVARSLSSGSINKMEPMPDCPDSEDIYIRAVSKNTNPEVFQDLIIGAALCNNVEQQIVQDAQIGQDIAKMKSELSVIGDAADTALYNMLNKEAFGTDIESLRKENPRLKALPFNSANKFMISANEISMSGERTVLVTMKGAPDIVIQRCSTYKTSNGDILNLDMDMKKRLFHRQEGLGRNGYRVIAMCHQKMSRSNFEQMINEYAQLQNSKSNTEEDLNGLPSNGYCFLGMFSLLDPPRPEVPEAVLSARRAQIRVAMVTGDHPTTAKAIAKQVHILTPEIADMNGVDTFQVEKENNGQLTLNLFRNDRLVKKHVPNRRGSVDQKKQILLRSSPNTQPTVKLPWYKRAWAHCLNQFTETKLDVPKGKKMEYIPYAVVVPGADISYMDDYMWDWVLSHQELVFARTTPEQKLRIVLEFQRRAEIVAVTGDGTNDAPALKSAHLGVAMQSGTQVSKDAGDMILLDNNFSSIIRAIETGRLLSENLKKVAVYLLPGGSWSQIWPVFFNLWFGMPLALSAFWATAFCMLNDVFMSLAMVTEKPERDIMSRPPAIREKDHLLNIKLLIHAYLFVGNLECFTAFFCFCYYWIDNGVPFYSFMFTFEKFGIDPALPYTKEQLIEMTNVAQSVYYCSMCLFQFFNLFATRTRYASIIQHNPIYGKGQNLYIFGAMIVSIGIQLIFTQIECFNRVLGTGKVPPKYVMPTLGFGMLLLILDELRKLCVRKYPRSVIARISW